MPIRICFLIHGFIIYTPLDDVRIVLSSMQIPCDHVYVLWKNTYSTESFDGCLLSNNKSFSFI